MFRFHLFNTPTLATTPGSCNPFPHPFPNTFSNKISLLLRIGERDRLEIDPALHILSVVLGCIGMCSLYLSPVYLLGKWYG
jgi:hypothetical protein